VCGVSIKRDQHGRIRRTHPTAVQDELAVGLMFAGGLFREPCGAGVKLEDVGCHGSTGGGGADVGGLRMISAG